MGLRDTLSLSLSLQKNNTELTLSPSSTAQIDIISARSPDGKKINNTDISKYITIAPEVVPI
jgi:hypothetical protein